MRGRGLRKRSVRRRHVLAAIHAVMTARRAMHGMAALHRLFGRRHGLAVKRIRRQRERQGGQQK